MALSAKVVEVTFASGSTSNVGVTGVGFQPKALVFFGTLATAAGSTGSGSAVGVGFTSGASESACVGIRQRDGMTAATDSEGQIRDDTCYMVYDPAADAPDGRATLVSFDADGFTLGIADAFSANYKVLVLALGGSDLSAKVLTNTSPNATGNFSQTGAGFQPTAAVFLSMAAAVASFNTQAVGTMGFGIATSSSKRGALNVRTQDNNANSNPWSLLATDACLAVIDGTPAIADKYDFVSFDADGYTVNKTANSAANKYAVLLLGGIQADVGTTTTQTSTGNWSKTGVGFQPRAVLLATRPDATASMSTPATPGEVVFGAFSSSTERGVFWSLDHNVGALSGGNPSDSFHRYESTRVLVNYDRSAADTASVIGEVDAVSLDAGGFTLNQVDADAQLSLVLYLALGDAVVAGPTPKVRWVGLAMSARPRGKAAGLRGGFTVAVGPQSAGVAAPTSAAVAPQMGGKSRAELRRDWRTTRKSALTALAPVNVVTAPASAAVQPVMIAKSRADLRSAFRTTRISALTTLAPPGVADIGAGTSVSARRRRGRRFIGGVGG